MASILRNKLLDEVVDRHNDDVTRKSIQLQMLKTVTGDRRATPLVKSDLNPEQMQKLSVFVSSLQKSLEQKAQSAKLLSQGWVDGKARENISRKYATWRRSA